MCKWRSPSRVDLGVPLLVVTAAVISPAISPRIEVSPAALAPTNPKSFHETRMKSELNPSGSHYRPDFWLLFIRCRLGCLVAMLQLRLFVRFRFQLVLGVGVRFGYRARFFQFLFLSGSVPSWFVARALVFSSRSCRQAALSFARLRAGVRIRHGA